MENETSTLISTKFSHEVPIFILGEPKKLEGSDNLSTFEIKGTDYTYVANTKEWSDKVGTKVAYIQPDSIVDLERSEFLFLKLAGAKNGRIKIRKIRGCISYGLLIPLPENCPLKENENAAEWLNVTHYEADSTLEPNQKNGKLNLSGGEACKPPRGVYPKYDIENVLKFGRHTFIENEEVVVVEKLDGSSSRYCFVDNQMHCGSRNEWKREFNTPPNVTLEELILKIKDETKAKEVFEKAVTNFKPKKNQWWVVKENNPGIEKFCKDHPGWCLFGEVYGNTNRLKYFGKNSPRIEFAAFDILSLTESGPKWLDFEDLVKKCVEYGIPMAPMLGTFPYNLEKLKELSSGKTLVLGSESIREGIVLRPKQERYSEKLGRVVLKLVSPEFLLL